MNLTCQQDFTIQYRKNIQQDHTFAIDVCFKKGEDMEIATEKLFKQDGISSVYFKNGYYNMLSDLNNSNSKSNTQARLQNIYDNPLKLQDITDKWDKYFEEQDLRESKGDDLEPFHRLSKKEVEQFIKICGDRKARFTLTELQSTFRLHIKKAKEIYDESVEKLNQKQAEDIETMSLEDTKEAEINKKVQQHLNKLEEEKLIFEKNLEDITQEGRVTLKETIKTHYERINNADDHSSHDMKSLPEKASKTLSKQSSITSKTAHSQIPKYKVQVMLGLQKKYPFKIKAVQRDITSFIEQEKAKNVFLTKNKNSLLEFIKSKYHLDNLDDCKDSQDLLVSLLNPFYGAFGSAIVTGLPYDVKSGKINLDNSTLDKLLKNEPGLHFGSYEDQIKNHASQNTLEDGSIIVSLHSNLGYNKYVFSLVEENLAFKEGVLENNLASILTVAIQKRVRKIIIPLEFINRKKMVSGVGSNENNGIIEAFNRMIRGLRSVLQQIAHSYLSSEFLYEVLVVIPRIDSENEALFARCKEILKKAFE